MTVETRKIILDSGKAYKFVLETVNWVEAVDGAITYNGTLAQFETEAEADAFWNHESTRYFIEQFQIDIESNVGGVPFLWLGANNSTGTWLWKGSGNDEEFTYENWGTDNLDDGIKSLAIALNDWPLDSTGEQRIWNYGQWNALDPSTQLYYLVEDPQDDESTYAEVVYTYTATGETRTLAEMRDAGWFELLEDNYGDKYQYPALYSNGVGGVYGEVLDMSGTAPRGDELLGWTVAFVDDGGTDPITGQSFNLDVDGNGEVGALSDGLMILRKMFSTAFPGAALTDGAIGSNAKRTTDEIHEYIQLGIDSMALDVDQDGDVGALGDGLMVIRHLFGTAFPGAALTEGALSDNSPYWNNQQPWLDVANNIDALI